MKFWGMFAFLWLAVSSLQAYAAGELQIVDAPAGQQVDVLTQINTSGTVFIKIVAQNGEACANFWWIKWPFGTVERPTTNAFRQSY
jgi:hypothetical protein